MGRTPAVDRRSQIGDAALISFSKSGFRLTQVADIARLAGTAPGTLYLYAPSKEALFLLAMERALGEESHEIQMEEGEIMDVIRRKLAVYRKGSSLTQAREFPDAPLVPLEATLLQLWDGAYTLGPVINLIERCAQDWPELASLFYHEWRPDLLGRLRNYLERGVAEGIVRRPPDISIAARLIVETIAWFAIHRHGDADGGSLDQTAVRTATIDALVHAYGARPQGDSFP